MVNKDSSNTPASLRRTHRGIALSHIQAAPGSSRADLARSFGFSEMAASRIVRDLLGAGIIEEYNVAEAGTDRRRRTGRPKIGLRINPEGVYAAGITVSAHYSEVSVCDANGNTVARQEVDNSSFRNVTNTARLYSEALQRLIEEAGINPLRIVGVGVALSAKTTPNLGESVHSEYFGWEADGGQFWNEIRRNIQLPVVVENIANALAISEMRFGVARNVSEFALVHVATFAGVGAVSGNHVVRGASGDAGRIGHFRAIETPLRCVCGRNDCVNLSATGFGILSRLGQLDHAAFDQSRLQFYARSLVAAVGDGANDRRIREAGAHLARALDPVGKLLAPELIVLSGILGAHDGYFSAVEQELVTAYEYGPDCSYELVKGQVAPFEAASLLALHTFCYSDRLDFERLNTHPDSGEGRAAYG